MREEILSNLKQQLDKDVYDVMSGKNIHLGVFSEPCLTYMLNGKKTIESRISKNKIAPYQKILKDDVVIVKKSGGEVVAYFTIKDVKFIDLKEVSINEIKDKYNKELCVSEEFWEEKRDSSYATLMFIDKLVKFEPFKIKKRGMQTWVCLLKWVNYMSEGKLWKNCQKEDKNVESLLYSYFLSSIFRDGLFYLEASNAAPKTDTDTDSKTGYKYDETDFGVKELKIEEK